MTSINKNKRKKRIFNKIITILLLIFILILFSTIIFLNVLSFKNTIIIFLMVLLISFGLVLCNFSKKKGFRIIGYFFSLILIIISLIIEIYLCNTLGFIFGATNNHYILRNYNIIVLENGKYQDLANLNNETIGIYNNDNNLKRKINKKIDINYKTYKNKDDLIEALLEEDVASIILEDMELDLINEINPDTYKKLKSIYKIEIKEDVSSIKNDIDINKDTFNIYISGIDTYGNINAVSRSDVNILVSVNPKKEKILLTWIPRDYYVDIGEDLNDKLTHTGMYGINKSIKAVENLLDVKVNYFSSVVKIIDILEGISVYNDETFTTNENITFEKGNIFLNGEEALSFVRDRKHVTGGDLGRGKNQIKVLEATIKKVLSKELLKKYNKLLDSLEGSFVTNIDQSQIFSFVKRELIKKRNWSFESNILTGTDDRRYTYSVSSQTLYVMIPSEESINNAQSKIKEVLN